MHGPFHFESCALVSGQRIEPSAVRSHIVEIAIAPEAGRVAMREVVLGEGRSIKVEEQWELENDAGAVVWDAALVLSYFLLHSQGNYLRHVISCMEVIQFPDAPLPIHAGQISLAMQRAQGSWGNP